MTMKQVTLFFAITAALSAQRVTDTRRAEIRGGGGDGKCTIEVRVDGTAEIEVYGDQARIRTLSGAPARFVRFQCNQAMPMAPNDFRFRGIDGRGRQDLVQPAVGGRPAVIRIDDPKGGEEGYTFDVEWRGGTDSGYSGGVLGGYNDGNVRRNRDRDRDRDRSDRWRDNDIGRNNSGNNYGWNREVSFRGRGEGYFRTNNGANDRIRNVEVNISRNGDVRANFETDSRRDLTLQGRVTRVDRDLVIADMSGPGARGAMEIRIDGNRVREVNMRTVGRENAELRWRN